MFGEAIQQKRSFKTTENTEKFTKNKFGWYLKKVVALQSISKRKTE